MEDKINRLIEILNEAKGIILELEESLPQQYSVLATSVQVFGFSTRAMNVLLSMGIKTVGELVGFSKRELRKQRTCGAFTVDDIEKKLKEVGIYLAE